MLLLVRVMSWTPALAGVAVTLVLVPVGSGLSRALGATRRRLVKCSDARLKLTTEVLLGIKTIKCALNLVSGLMRPSSFLETPPLQPLMLPAWKAAS